MFRDDAFRYAICMFSTLGLIRWHENRVAFLRSVRRLLGPGGKLVVHVHNRFSNIASIHKRLWLLKSYLLGPFRGMEVGDIVGEYRGIPNMFLHTFSPRELRRLLTEAGFALRRMILLDPSRSGPLEGRWFTTLRNSGMIAVADR
jgi:SAM-dependent methyltransferase